MKMPYSLLYILYQLNKTYPNQDTLKSKIHFLLIILEYIEEYSKLTYYIFKAQVNAVHVHQFNMLISNICLSFSK